MATGGYKLGASTSIDSSSSVSAGGTLAGSSFDLGASTSPQAVRTVAQFAITNSGTTDGYDLEVKVQWSEDNSTWPDSGEGTIVMVRTSTTAGADITWTQWIELPEPKARYARFFYTNNNGTDSLSVSSKVAQHILQSA